MQRFWLILGIVFTLVSWATAADTISEDFESYTAGDPIAGSNGWEEVGRGEWFQAVGTLPADPSAMGSMCGSLGNNGLGSELTNSWLYQGFSPASGQVTMSFDAYFPNVGEADSCNMYLSAAGKTPSEFNFDDIAAAVNVGTSGLRVYDGGWQDVTNFALLSETWYRFTITADTDTGIWNLGIATWVGDSLTASTTVEIAGADSFFAFRDPSVTEVGLAEFMCAEDLMALTDSRGVLVDNINVPEPMSLGLLAIGGLAIIRRRRK